MKRILVNIGLVFLVFFQINSYAQDYSKFKPIAINGYYFKNILPFTESNQVGFGVVIPAYINNDSLIDFYSTKTKYPQNGNSVYEVSTFEIFINQGNFVFKKDTKQYVKDSVFIIRDDGISAIADYNGDGVNDLVFAGEPFHYNPQSAYYNIGMRNKIDVDSSKGYARRPNILISNNGKLIDSIGYLDTLLLKSYFGGITFDWNNDGKSDLVLAERGDGKTFQFWENKGNKMSVSYPILERDSLQVSEGPFNLAAYDLNKDGFKDFIFSSQVESYISQNGNVYVCFNDNGIFNNTSVVNIINHRNLPVEKNGLRVSDIQVNDLDNDGNPEIISLFSNGSGDHSAIDNNKIKSIFKITTYKDGKFIDVTKNYFPTQLNENLFYSNRQFKLIDLDNDGLLDIYPITGDNGCTTKYPQGCGYFGFQGIDSTVYFKNKKDSFELISIGLFFSDTVSQNVYNEFKQRKINIGGYNLALGNQIVPYFFKGISKPVFVAGIQKGSVEMYEGEIYNDSLKNLRTRVTQNSFLNYNFRPGFLMVPCDVKKPLFNISKFTFCSGDSLKLSITNVNKGDSLKWYYGNKSDLSNVGNKSFTDSAKLFVTRTDTLGCIISSDTVSLVKYSTPSIPTLSKDSTSYLVSNAKFGNTWYRDGLILADTSQQISLSNNGYYTVKTMQNSCISSLSVPYYYSSSFVQQQVVAKLKTYNFDVTNKNIADSIHLNNALVRGQTVLYNVGKTQHLILNPNDRYYFPGYHFINKDGNWKFENMYNSLIMEGPYGYSVYDSLGNLAISSTGDEGRTVYGDLFYVKTSGDSLIANKISLDKRPYSDVSTTDINQDGLMDIVTYGGVTSSTPYDNFIRLYVQQKDGSFINKPSLMPSSKFYIGEPSIDYTVQLSGYALNSDYLYSEKFPQILRGQYSSSTPISDHRYGVAIHSFNEKTGVFDSLKLISTLGVYQDTMLGTTSIRVADLNNDGKKDFVIKYETPTGNLTGLEIFMNDGRNNFIAGQSFTFPPNRWNDGGFVLADLNQDGWVDILLSPISGTDFYINSSQINDNTLGVKLQNSILLNNKGTFDFLKNDLSVFGPKPIYLKSNFINNQIKYVGFGFPDGNNGNPVLTAPSGAIKMYDFTVTFCKNLIKPTFNTSKFLICSGDSLKLSITNINKGDSLKWYYGSKSDLTNTSNKIFTDSTKLFVTRTDTLGCIISSDTVKLFKFTTPSTPVIIRDTANYLSSGTPGTTWYKDGVALTDTAQKIKPTAPGSYTAKTTQNGCISLASNSYYYLVTDLINLSSDEFIKLAPNPFTNQLNFDFVVKGYQRLNLEVFDMATGTKVASKQNQTAGIPIYLGQLAAGTYLIKVSSNDNKIAYQFKMVKL